MRPISASCLLAMSFSISVASRAQDPAPAGQAELPARKVATFSICAADPEVGVCEAAVARMYPDVGHVVPYVRGGVGAFCTQHYHVPAWGERALDLLAAGKSPQSVLAELLVGVDQPGMRQLGLVSAVGQTAQHNPTDAPARSRYWGAQAGRSEKHFTARHPDARSPQLLASSSPCPSRWRQLRIMAAGTTRC